MQPGGWWWGRTPPFFIKRKLHGFFGRGKFPELWPMPERAKPCSEHSEGIFLPHGPEIRSTWESNPGRGGATGRPRPTELATLGWYAIFLSSLASTCSCSQMKLAQTSTCKYHICWMFCSEFICRVWAICMC